jgi:hypothetical protein
MPIVRVTPDAFNQAAVDKLAAALLGDGPLYDPESLCALTQSDIASLLIKLKQRKAELEKQGLKPSAVKAEASVAQDGAVAMSGAINQLDEVISSIGLYENMQKTALKERSYVKTAFKIDDSAGNSFATAGRLNQKGGMMTLMAINDSSSYHRVQFVNRGDYDSGGGNYYSEAEFTGQSEDMEKAEAAALSFPSITAQAARAVTDRLLKTIGIGYLECTQTEKVIGGSGGRYGGVVRMGSLMKAYRVQYVRKVAGVPVTYTSVESTWNDTQGESWSWEYERMTFIVDDSGIVEMTWSAPYKIAETITPSAAMLSFSEIQDIFRKMIVVNMKNLSDNKTDLNISEVRLGLARITEQNNLASGLLVPVWDFFGTAVYHYKTGELQTYRENVPGESYLTINAIDGSIIDRNLGY